MLGRLYRLLVADKEEKMDLGEGPSASYQKLISNGPLIEDRAQVLAAKKLQFLHDQLDGYGLDDFATPWIKKILFRSSKPQKIPKGLYIHGGVGRGKSMLMDLFFGNVGVKRKRRIHFHEFMQEAHELIHIWRQNNKSEKQAEPIRPVAVQLAKKTALICFDEFEVRDIADAMIVSRLFTVLLELGVVVVATSNRHPDELYKNGLQRELFLPFVDLIKTKMNILCLQEGKDYRLDRLKKIDAYVHPAGYEATILLNQTYNDLTDGNLGKPESIEFKGRQINVPRAFGPVAFFGFKDLCSVPLGAGDYLLLAKRFRSIIVSDIPAMTDENKDLARRFMVLIDALYENKTHVIFSAATEPSNLYQGSDWGFEFDRTVSRLLEMQSVEYIEAARQ